MPAAIGVTQAVFDGKQFGAHRLVQQCGDARYIIDMNGFGPIVRAGAQFGTGESDQCSGIPLIINAATLGGKTVEHDSGAIKDTQICRVAQRGTTGAPSREAKGTESCAQRCRQCQVEAGHGPLICC